MKHLENTIKFISRYYIILLPLLILSAIPALIEGTSGASLTKRIGGIISGMNDPMSLLNNPGELFGLVTDVMMVSIVAGLFGLVLKFIMYPAVYGIINKTLDNNYTDIKDFIPALKNNFLKYLFYWAGTIVLGVLVGITCLIVIAIPVLIMKVVPPLGILLLILLSTALVLALVAFGVLTSLWFAAMIVDKLDVMSALFKSVDVAKKGFIQILGVSLLIWFAQVVASFLLFFFGYIPVIGPVIMSIIPAAAEFIMITFYLIIYRDIRGLSNTI